MTSDERMDLIGRVSLFNESTLGFSFNHASRYLLTTGVPGRGVHAGKAP
jgi:hypothetical protein